ncbi:hypothetical protein ACS0TY_035120 [Phlomoides rotata]
MTRSGLITAALVVALMVATVFDCMQINIFSNDECKKKCVLASAKYTIRKATLEEDDNKFVPLWI